MIAHYFQSNRLVIAHFDFFEGPVEGALETSDTFAQTVVRLKRNSPMQGIVDFNIRMGFGYGETSQLCIFSDEGKPFANLTYTKKDGVDVHSLMWDLMET